MPPSAAVVGAIAALWFVWTGRAIALWNVLTTSGSGWSGGGQGWGGGSGGGSGGFDNGASSDLVNQILAYAATWVGTPYVFGAKGTSPGQAVDCSGFTDAVFAHFNINIQCGSGNTGTGMQYTCQDNIDDASAQPGDLVFFATSPDSRETEHVGIVAADTSQMYNAFDENYGVILGPISSVGNLLGYKRPQALTSWSGSGGGGPSGGGSGGFNGGMTQWCDGDSSNDPSPPSTTVTISSRYGIPPADLNGWVQVIWPPDQWTNAVDIAYQESRWQKCSVNDNTAQRGPCGTPYILPTGMRATSEVSKGYFQINCCNAGHAAQGDNYWLYTKNNVQKAYDLYKANGNYSAWACSAYILGLPGGNGPCF